MNKQYDCPGKHLHEGEDGKCEFCKSDKGNPQSIGEMPEIDKLTGERLVKACCKACANNLNRSNVKQFNRTSVS